mmetsp:Transcript_20784/g.65778  ORF Transcript_20784/g.65778 Transcript_20784/m.65778 type:complete len:218 (+) Transcript_20784:1922-2575(+)
MRHGDALRAGPRAAAAGGHRLGVAIGDRDPPHRAPRLQPPHPRERQRDSPPRQNIEGLRSSRCSAPGGDVARPGSLGISRPLSPHGEVRCHHPLLPSDRAVPAAAPPPPGLGGQADVAKHCQEDGAHCRGVHRHVPRSMRVLLQAPLPDLAGGADSKGVALREDQGHARGGQRGVPRHLAALRGAHPDTDAGRLAAGDGAAHPRGEPGRPGAHRSRA